MIHAVQQPPAPGAIFHLGVSANGDRAAQFWQGLLGGTISSGASDNEIATAKT
ncbi:MAG: hypothetical protein AAGH67_14140 [Cyanobacteria bacterium P01_H01_bin.162]